MDRIKYRMTGTSILDKISSIKGTDRRRKGSKGRIDSYQSLEELNRIQTFIFKMSDHETNSKFEQMLDDMNLSEEKKAPLRLKTVEQKRSLLAMQYKGSVLRNTTDSTSNDFINELKKVPKIKKDERYEVVSSLRIALTNKTVSWMKDFGEKQGLNYILKCLSYSCDDWEERKSTLECVKCLVAYSNNKFGLKQLIQHKDATTLLMRCIDPPTQPPSSSSSSSSSYRSSSLQSSSLLSYNKTSLSKTPSSYSSPSSSKQVSFEAVKLLAAISLVPPHGLNKVLEGATICGEMRGRLRFESVVQGLSSCDLQMKLACMQLINAMVCTPDDLDFRIHLRNEVSRTGLCDVIGSLQQQSNEELQRQVRVWLEHQDDDAEEFSQRYENVRFHMQNPRECFEVLLQSTLNTPSEDYFVSILQHLLSIREDHFARLQYYKLIEECVSQIVLHRSGIDPDFRCSRRFQLDLDPLLEKLQEEDKTMECDDDDVEKASKGTLKTRLDEVTMAKHELEAASIAHKEKITAYESEIIELRTKLNMDIGSLLSSTIKPPSTTTTKTTASSNDSSIPPPPPLPNMGPGSIPIPPPPIGGNLMMIMKPKVPSFVKEKKKYNPPNQMKRANWVKINLQHLKKESFWSKVREEEYEDEMLFEELISDFAFKNIEKKDETDNNKQYKKAKELKILDAKSAQNLSILLGSLKLPHEEIKRRIVQIDYTNLTSHFLQQLLKLLPTQDIINKLAGLKDQYDSLTEPEQFGVVISSVRRLLPRLSSMLFHMKFQEMLTETKPEIMSATVAMEEVMESKAFGEVLKIILLLGNFMNAGSRNECTIGFELSFIPKIVNTKSRDNSKSLMTFLVQHLQHKHPHLLSFIHDFIHLEQASKVSLDSLTKNISGMKVSVRQLETDLKNARNDKQPPMKGDAFIEVMTPFLERSKEQVGLLEGMHKAMVKKYTGEMAVYFCIDHTKYTLDEFFSDLKLFVDQFQESCREIERQKEIEAQQKRQKEMEKRWKEERMMKRVRKKMLVDIHADDDQEGVMDNLLEALKTASAFHVGKKRPVKKRNSRLGGAERRTQLVHTRSRQGILSPSSQQPSLTNHPSSNTSPLYKASSANKASPNNINLATNKKSPMDKSSPLYKTSLGTKTSATSPSYSPSSFHKSSKTTSSTKVSPSQRQMQPKYPHNLSQKSLKKSPVLKTYPRNHPQTIKKHSPSQKKSTSKQLQEPMKSLNYTQQQQPNSLHHTKDDNVSKIKNKKSHSKNVISHGNVDENDINVDNYTASCIKDSTRHKEKLIKNNDSKTSSHKLNYQKSLNNSKSSSPHSAANNSDDLLNSFRTEDVGDFEDLLEQLRAL